MHTDLKAAENRLAIRLRNIGHAEPREIAWATVWLQACGYTGFKLLAEALPDERKSLTLTRDALGIDLQEVSCAYLAPAIMADVKANGRVFLRNVRHGLFMLPFAVRENMGLGCPVDPSFAIGGERLKNPYAEKLALAEASGIDVDDGLWDQLLDH
ncbi:MAG: hypothetical protein IOC86_15790 [Aestuariivirga sp.]|nr:hypothetical protein [Aestuariivirga sp.]